jgi:carboxymethylenebutenolidase
MMNMIKSESISYAAGDDLIKAYLSYPDDAEKHPGVVLIHEIFGLDDHTKNVADRLAAEGYVVLAPHLFSSNKLSPVLSQQNISITMKFMMSLPVDKQRDEKYRAEAIAKLDENEQAIISEVNQLLFVNRPIELMTEYLSYGVDYLKSLEKVSSKIGSAGFCFGGGMSINLGCTGKTSACVIFYGENPKPIEKIKNVNGFIMGLYGGEDHRINSGLGELVKAMVEYNKPFTIRIFPGAYHAFFNDTRPQTYNKQAAEEAWSMLLKFFNDNLK